MSLFGGGDEKWPYEEMRRDKLPQLLIEAANLIGRKYGVAVLSIGLSAEGYQILQKELGPYAKEPILIYTPMGALHVFDDEAD